MTLGDTLRRPHLAGKESKLTLSDFKAMVGEQSSILLIDQEAAIAAIPGLLPDDLDRRRQAFDALREVLSARGEIAGEAAQRLARIGEFFGGQPSARPAPKLRSVKS